jgi:hypothetical protein
MRLSNQTVLNQIRRNLTDQMLGQIERGENHSDEFMRFLALEPVQLNWDIYERLTRAVPMRMGMGRIPQWRIQFHNPIPVLRSGGFHDRWLFFKEKIRFRVKAVFLKWLSQHLVYETQPVSLVVSQIDLNSNRHK